MNIEQQPLLSGWSNAFCKNKARVQLRNEKGQ